jgi:two-component system phosphate regulon sensor histidine kinase PhoR
VAPKEGRNPDEQGEMREYLHARFIAALDRFQVHRALLTTLQELSQFSACCILLKSDPCELFILPCSLLKASFLDAMIQRIADAANRIGFPRVEAEQLSKLASFDTHDDLLHAHTQDDVAGTEIGSSLNVPLTVENRIIGLLSLFTEKTDTFDTDLLQQIAMIADYTAVALENVRPSER